uniref:Uncharacterized protein n=1 Tax=Mycena chlorophos TaxID=658473 RepID=A0ABQ0KXR6_MYCCL|nr:predicted protein [Mycena chlorophos]
MWTTILLWASRFNAATQIITFCKTVWGFFTGKKADNGAEDAATQAVKTTNDIEAESSQAARTEDAQREANQRSIDQQTADALARYRADGSLQQRRDEIADAVARANTDPQAGGAVRPGPWATSSATPTSKESGRSPPHVPMPLSAATSTLSSPVSPISASAESSTDPIVEKTMSISLSAIASAVSKAIAAAKAAEPAVVAVYTAAANMVVGVESAYEGVANAGGTKLAAVLAGAKEVATELSQDWTTLEGDVTSMVAAVKTAYNSAVSAVSTLSAAATPAAAPAAAA